MPKILLTLIAALSLVLTYTAKAFQVENETDNPISKLWCHPCGTSYWSIDLLDAVAIPARGSFAVNMNEVALCDIKLEYRGEVSNYSQIDLTKVRTVVVSLKDNQLVFTAK